MKNNHTTAPPPTAIYFDVELNTTITGDIKQVFIIQNGADEVNKPMFVLEPHELTELQQLLSFIQANQKK